MTAKVKPVRLSSPQWTMLMEVAESPSSGLFIRIFSLFERTARSLVKKGLLSSHYASANRTEYRITEAGQSALIQYRGYVS